MIKVGPTIPIAPKRRKNKRIMDGNKIISPMVVSRLFRLSGLRKNDCLIFSFIVLFNSTKKPLQ